MKKSIKKIAMLFMVCGLSVSVSFGVDLKDFSQYKELKAWIEDMNPHLKANKWTDPDTIKEYGEYPRLKIFMNDLEFLDDLDVERKKEENKGKNFKQIMRELANSPKWNGADRGKYETHYYDGMNNPLSLLSIAIKDTKKIESDLDLANAKARAFQGMGGEIRIRKWSE